MRFVPLWIVAGLMVAVWAPECPSGDDDTPTPLPCGDAEIMARFNDCIATQDMRSCEAEGGTWTTVGLYPEPQCLCPTGQEGCACNGPNQCLSLCAADFNPGNGSCEGVTEGACSAYAPTVGCFCLFFEDGTAQGICID